MTNFKKFLNETLENNFINYEIKGLLCWLNEGDYISAEMLRTQFLQWLPDDIVNVRFDDIPKHLIGYNEDSHWFFRYYESVIDGTDPPVFPDSPIDDDYSGVDISNYTHEDDMDDYMGCEKERKDFPTNDYAYYGVSEKDFY